MFISLDSHEGILRVLDQLEELSAFIRCCSVCPVSALFFAVAAEPEPEPDRDPAGGGGRFLRNFYNKSSGDPGLITEPPWDPNIINVSLYAAVGSIGRTFLRTCHVLARSRAPARPRQRLGGRASQGELISLMSIHLDTLKPYIVVVRVHFRSGRWLITCLLRSIASSRALSTGRWTLTAPSCISSAGKKGTKVLVCAQMPYPLLTDRCPAPSVPQISFWAPARSTSIEMRWTCADTLLSLPNSPH